MQRQPYFAQTFYFGPNILFWPKHLILVQTFYLARIFFSAKFLSDAFEHKPCLFWYFRSYYDHDQYLDGQS